METNPGNNNLMQMLLSEESHSKLKRLVTTYMMAETALKSAHRYWKKKTAPDNYTIAIGSHDEIYPFVHEWLLDKIPVSEQKNIIIRTNSGEKLVADTSSKGLTRYYDSSKEQIVNMNGQKITVQLERPDMSDSALQRLLMSGRNFEERIMFIANGETAREEVINFLSEISSSQVSTKAKLYISSRWGDWINRSELPPRNLDTVILPAKQKQFIVNDLAKFLGQQELYTQMDIPYHRGYLFHGVAGTGKTSLAKALANNFNLDVYYLQLSTLSNDSYLNPLLAQVSARSILLLEDIDVVHGAKERDDKSDGVTLTGLLNALDGFMTPHGLITIMTTNKLDTLDESLIRPGRVDCLQEIGYINSEQLAEMMNIFLGIEFNSRVEKDITPAQIIDIFKKNLDNLDMVPSDVRELIN